MRETDSQFNSFTETFETLFEDEPGGADRCSGGSDTYLFAGRDGRDRERDFADGKDQLLITDGAGRFRDLTIKQQGDDRQISFARTRITLQDMRKRDVGLDDVTFTVGFDGDVSGSLRASTGWETVWRRRVAGDARGLFAALTVTIILIMR